ncbi:MAG: hypothetical protein ABI051_16470 [Vicinamibacterales bacterium]
MNPVITRGDLIRIATETNHMLYQGTGNPIHLWAAYQQARAAKGIPGWIIDYFDECASRLLAPGGASSSKVIAAAFGLGTQGGGRSAGARARKAQQHLAVGQMVRHRRHKGQTATEAIFDVSEEIGLSYDTVKEIVTRRSPKRKRRKVVQPAK